MSEKGVSTLCVLLWLFASSMLWTSTASGDEHAYGDYTVVKNLLAAKRYDDADNKAMLMLEQALQKESLSQETFIELGLLLQQASRFEVSKAIFSAALEGFTTQGNLGEMGTTLYYLAVSERQLSNYTTALSYIRRALSIAQIQHNELLKAKLNLELGTVQQEQGDIEAALDTLKQALQFFRESSEATLAGVSLLRIGDIYSLLNQTSLAHTYYKDAFDTVGQSSKDKRLLGMAKSRLGALQLKNGQTDNAVASIANGLDFLLAANDEGGIAEANILMGKALIETGDVRKGIELLQEAMHFAISSGQAKLVKEGRLALAQAYVKEQDFEQALSQARMGTIAARKNRDIRGQLSFLSIQLSAFVSQGEFKKALDIQSVIQQLREALMDSQSKTAIEGLQAEIELVRQSRALEKLAESKKLALAQAEQENLRTTLIWSITLAGLLMMFLVWSRFKQRQQTIILRREVRQQTLTLQEKNDELKRAYKTLEEVSLRDPLTGLYNRHYLEAHLPGELRRSQFAINQPKDKHALKQDLLCLLIDIDHFKRINDDYGHIAGDKVLAAFAQILKEVFRQTDLIIRWGGEEFLVVCRHSSREELPLLAERCREMVASTPFDIDTQSPISITCSIGFSLLPPEKMESFDAAWERTFTVIDYALYAAKLSGRDGWVGVIETYDEHRGSLTPMDVKFHFPSSRIATSFNNVASITWPDHSEEQ